MPFVARVVAQVSDNSNYRELEKEIERRVEEGSEKNAKNYETDIIIAESIEALGYFFVLGINKRNRIGRCDS